MNIKPLKNLRIRQSDTIGILHICADLYLAGIREYQAMYANKSVSLADEGDSVESLEQKCFEACADMLARIWGSEAGKPGGPWRDVYRTCQHDIRRQIVAAVKQWRSR